MIRFFTLLLCSLLVIQPLRAEHKSTIKESVKTVKTYPFSDPDPVADPSKSFYPYFRFDGFAAVGADKQWKVVELENGYIKVTVFPEIGGKIWGAVDKTTGKEFIYYNHVVKFRDIAMRGAWTSGGIELNFGIIGHAPTTATPVDYTIKEKEDGSVSYYVASYDWLTRTYWNVEVNLPADKAYFTTTTTWYNQSMTSRPYYQWMNAAYKAAGNAHFYYPGDHYIGHTGIPSSFPIDGEGRDLSWYNNNAFGNDKSEHVLGYYNDFYGVYWHDIDFGSVHHAAFTDKLGMKIFLWEQSRAGEIWKDLLTDSDGQYIELQSGRMYNQPVESSAYTPFKHYGFDPGETDRWTEYWFPVAGIGGISKASNIGALCVTKEEDVLKLAFSPLEDISTEVRIYDMDKEVKSVKMEAKALTPWTITLPGLGTIPDGNLKIIIGDNALVYSEQLSDYQLNRPLTLPSDFDWESTYGLFTLGQQWMNTKAYAAAERCFLKALEKDPYYVPALNKLASLYVQSGLVDKALPLLTTSLSLDTYDGEANYQYGLCCRQKGMTADAKSGFSIAARSAAYRSAAYTCLAEMYLKEGDWANAEHFALQSLSYNYMDLKAKQVLMVVYRKTGKPERAAEQIESVLANLPLYHFARFEKLYGTDDSWKDEFKALVRNEFPFETYMEMALWYESVGCEDEELALLECAGDYPIALYHRAYILGLTGAEDESIELLNAGNAASPEMVFPFRAENIKVLEWASGISENWKIKYYLGLVCWANGRETEAMDWLSECGDPDYAPFYLTRAKLKKSQSSKDNSYIEDILKAEKTTMSWRGGMALMNFYADEKSWDKVVETGEKYLREYPANYYIGLRLAKGYFETGKYSDCVRLLSRVEVSPSEGEYAGRPIYRSANLCLAMDYIQKKNYKQAQNYLTKALDWPENLGAGKPYNDLIDTRLEDYIQSYILSDKGDIAGATAALEKVSDYKQGRHFPISSDLLSALALRKLGRAQEADKLMESWSEKYPDSDFVKWGIAVYNGDRGTATTLQKENETFVAPWKNRYGDADIDLMVRFLSSYGNFD